MKPQKFLRFTFFIIALAGFSLVTFGQSAPEKINYQAVARDNNGNVMSQATIDVYFTIMDGSSNSVYEEEHTSVTTNDYGLFSLAIGDGNTQSGTFSGIDWGSGQHMVKVEVDDGSGYTSMGTSELNSVPYSLYAKESAFAKESGAWSVVSGGLVTDSAHVGINTGISSGFNLAVERDGNTSGGGLATIYGDRTGADDPNQGGSSWASGDSDVAIKGSSFWGSNYTAGVIGYNYLDYENSAGIVGYDQLDDVFGAMAYKLDGNKYSVYANDISRFDGNVGIGTEQPEAPLDISGGNWDLENSEGDLRIGGVDSEGIDNRLKISMATAGQGAGHAAINAFGYAPQVRLGASANDILIVDSLGVGVRTDDNNHPREEELHIVQDSDIGNDDVGLAFELGSDGSDPGNNWRIGINDGVNDFDVYYNGSIKAFINDDDGSWNATSDRRLKEAIEKPEPVLNKVMNLSPKKFYYKSSRQKDHKSYGFIAQEVEETFPEFVSDRGDGIKGIPYGKLSVVSIQAIQEQQEIIDDQKKQIKELQSELDEIKDALDEAGISVE